MCMCILYVYIYIYVDILDHRHSDTYYDNIFNRFNVIWINTPQAPECWIVWNSPSFPVVPCWTSTLKCVTEILSRISSVFPTNHVLACFFWQFLPRETHQEPCPKCRTGPCWTARYCTAPGEAPQQLPLLLLEPQMMVTWSLQRRVTQVLDMGLMDTNGC